MGNPCWCGQTSLSAKYCQTHNLHTLFTLLIELVSESIHLELRISSGISSTAPVWTHFEIFSSSVLCSFHCTEHPLPALGKCPCSHNVLLAGTIAVGGGFSLSKSWTQTGWGHGRKQIWTKILELRLDLGEEEKKRVGQGQGKQRMRTAAVTTALKIIDPVSVASEHSYMMLSRLLELQVASEYSFYAWCSVWEPGVWFVEVVSIHSCIWSQRELRFEHTKWCIMLTISPRQTPVISRLATKINRHI